MANLGYIWSAIFLINIVINSVLTTPLYTSQYFPNGNGRNIRNLPCLSLRSGETGVCMFAFDCVRNNGTHLGTCLDRFYFGSCCKLVDEPSEIYPQDNSIEDASSSSSLITTRKPFESNDIPDYSIKPKPERLPSSSTTKRITTAIPLQTTTQMSIGLSTFQTVQSSHSDSTVTKTTAANTQIYTTNSQKVSATTQSTVKRPTTVMSSKPTFNSTIALDRNPPATRFPPRNTSTTTTTPKPSTTVKKSTTKVTTTQKSTTPRPISVVTKRPTTATSPKKPTTITKPTSTTVKPTPITKPSIGTVATTHLQPQTSVTNATKLDSSATTSSITKKPTQSIGTTHKLSTTPRTTTATRPVVTTSKPRPSSQPTKTSSVTATKPTPKPASRPTVDLTHKPRPTTTSSKPTPKPKPTGKPTGKPAKPSKPVKPTQSTNVGTTTNKLPNLTQASRITTESTSVITTLTTNKPTTKPTTTTSTTITTTPTTTPTTTTTTSTTTPKTTTTSTSTTTTTERPTTMTNEVLKSTVTPGFITWSSNSDDLIMESSTTSSTPSSTTTTTTTTYTPDSAVDTDWSPITSSDGWIMIQSPTTKKPDIIDEAVTELKPSKFPSTTVELLMPESTTQRLTTMKPTTKPTVPTVASPSSDGTSSIPVTSTTTPSPVMPTDQLNMSDYKQVCGRRMFPESRIVGGDPSAFGKWPWQISLRQWRTSAFLHKCGAALLNENWAITAAHCVENVPPSDLLLRMGEHDLANEDEPYGFQERRVQIVASHPQFDPRTYEYDLALLRFYEPLLPFQPNLLPICLPDDDEEYVNRTAYVTGWGRLYEDGPLPSVLQEVSVPVINNTLCELMYRNAGYIEHIPHIFICAGWRKGGFDSCEGDSGGPLAIQRARDKRWILAGVISWGIGCAVPNQPGVYTRISEFREWINQILQF